MTNPTVTFTTIVGTYTVTREPDAWYVRKGREGGRAQKWTRFCTVAALCHAYALADEPVIAQVQGMLSARAA